MKQGKTSARHLDAKIKISLIVIAILAVALVFVAGFTLPTMAPVNRQDPPKITAIVPQNGGLISQQANLEAVYVTVKYSDGTSAEVALSEMIATGLDTTELGECDNVILNYGGFTQSVTYEVVPTKIELTYTPSAGGRVEGETKQLVDPGDTAGTVVAIPEEGYRFVEWSDGSKSATRTDIRVSKNQELVAVFEKLKYTVVFFYPDGTTQREELVPYNEAAIRVPHESESHMKLYGYKFIGWSEDYSHITSDSHIYPQYEKYAADFHLEMTKSIEGTDLGKVEDLKEYYTIGEIANVRVKANPDRTFVGWSIRNHSGDWVNLLPENDSQLISIGDAFNYISFATTKTGTIDQFTLSFEPTENTVEIFVKANFIYDESELRFLSMGNLEHSEILPKYTPIGTVFDVTDASLISAITGYTFKGWYVRGGEVDAQGNPVIITNAATFTQPTDLIAQWEKDVYRVVFLRGENESPEFITNPYYSVAEDGIVLDVYYQDALAGAVRGSFPEGVPTRQNYTFKGWYLMQDGGVTDRIIDKTFQVDQPVTYVAPVFVENTQTISVIKQNGAGNVYLSEDGEARVPVTGIATMKATHTYTVYVEASTGYTMELMRVRSDSGTIDVTSTEFTIRPPVTSDYELTVTFGLTEYDLNVTNGIDGTSGTIIYQELQGNELQTVRNTSLSVSTKVSRGVAKHVWIEAPHGLTIASVSVDGVRRDDLPLNANNYTLVLTGIQANVTVIVTYDENKYTVTLPNSDGQTAGTVVKMTAGERFGMNDRPQFRVTAQEGYYIKSFSINGLTVDPYGIYDADSAVYAVSDLQINGKVYSTDSRDFSVKDVRLTSYVVTLNGVDCEKTLNVEFEEIYYEIRMTAVGMGTVTPVYSKVSLNGDASGMARATDGYYVYSATVNGEETVYTDRLSDRMIELTDVNEDKNVTVTFRKRIYTVTFEEGVAGTDTKVSYTDRAETVRESYLPTSADVDANTSGSFKITSNAEQGYLLEAIVLTWYEDGVLHRQPVTLGFDVSEYTLQMNNISRNYTVRVDSQLKNLSVSVRTANGEGVKVSATANGEADLQTSVNFSSTFTMFVIVPEGKGFDPADAVLNIAKDTYTFAPVGDTGNAYRLEVIGLRTDLTVYLPFTAVGTSNTPYNVVLEYAANEGILTANKSSANYGESVTFQVEANRHYALAYLFVNGKPVSVQEGAYVAENVEEDLYVQAVFEKIPYQVVITPAANGVVTADRELAVNGQDVTLRLVPATGYVVSMLSVRFGTGAAHLATQDELDYVNAGHTDYTVRGAEIVDNMYVEATFSAMVYRLTVTSEGEGNVNVRDTNANYGETIREAVSTDENHFIQSIEVNGVQTDPAELANAILNPDILRYTGGTLIYRITGDTEIKVTFAPNIYRVNVTRTLHGTTRVKVQDGVYSDGNALELSADTRIYIHMLADTGYHIKDLYINGTLVDEVLWKSDFDRANNNRNIEYCLEHVNGTVSVRVEYEINTYNVQVNTVNNSINFARFDTVSSDYGTVRIYGYQGEDGLFEGIRHGSDLRFIISPVRVKGYYITSFRVTWVNPDDKNSGAATVVDLTSAINPTGGEYVWRNVRGDLQSVEVQFRRELYSLSANIITDQKGTPFACTGDITYQVTNPRATSSEVQLVENKYEYGLTYIVRANPGTGYERTQFLVNGEDGNALVRNNAYSGTVQGDLDMVATYTIRSYEVRLTWNREGGNARVEDESGIVLWAPGFTGGQTVFTNSGRVEIYADYLLVTHGTKLYFILIPFNGQNTDENGDSYDNGYMTASFNINNRRMDTAVDDVSRVRYAAEGDVSAVADFQLHTYEVTYDAMGGAYVTLEPSTVVWGTGTTITVSPHEGYQLKYVSVNDVDNRDMATAINNTNRYAMFNIRNDVHILLAYERIPYSITFTGKYHHTETIEAGTFVMQTGVVLNEGYSNAVGYFTEDGVFDWSAQKPSDIFGMANTGIVEGGGAYGPRHGDILTMYFMPANGYRISAVSVTMADGRQVVTKVSNINDLFLCNEAKGYYSVNIGSMTGNVTVQVEYEIKTYRLTASILGEGRADADYGATTYAHHDKLSLEFTAAYGYHLAGLEINGQPMETAYEKVMDAGCLVYRYRTAELQVTDNLMNRMSEIRISATFRVNTFRVLMYVNGKIVGVEDSDITLTPELSNSEISAGLNAYIMQNRAEGYSITSIRFSNNKSSGATELSGYDTAANRASAILTFMVSGDVADMLDYHSTGDDRYLRIDYTTEIDRHTSVMNTALFETGYDEGTDEIPEVDGVPAFSLQKRYAVTPGYEANGNPYPYFTTAEFQLNITSSLSSLYTFTGFQEKMPNGTWEYVKDGENGISITSEGRVLTYTIKGDREFRAAVYRVYNVEVQIHPEYKYIGGTYYGNSGDMNYSTYGRLVATANYTEQRKPDIPGLSETVDDADGVDNATYTYRVLYGTRLILAAQDRNVQYNNTRSRQYWEIDTSSGTLQQYELSMEAGQGVGDAGTVIGKDTLIHAYFRNNMRVSVKLETEGGDTGSEGGTVSYTVNGGSAVLGNNSLQVYPNDVVEITVRAKENYRIDTVCQQDYDARSSALSGKKEFLNTWTELQSDGIGWLSVTKQYSGARVSEMTVRMRVTENTILRIRFIKLIRMSARVELAVLPDSTVGNDMSNLPSQDAINQLTPVFSGRSADGTYDYGDQVDFRLNAPDTMDIWGIRYQFAGYFVNGVNSYKMLSIAYPEDYDITYHLYNYDELTAPDGVPIETRNGAHYVEIVARYVPVFNITLENEYYFESGSTSRYFDPGQISYSAITYHREYPMYYESAAYVEGKTGENVYTDRSFQVLGKINTVSGINNSANSAASGYNTWTDNVITLNWVGAANIDNAAHYTFEAWEFYSAVKREWVSIPYVDPVEESNMVTRRVYSFPVPWLFGLSYQMDRFSPAEGYKYVASQYTESGEFLNRREISTIRIRPRFQRTETMTIDRIMYYTQMGIVDDEHASDCPAVIEGTANLTTGDFAFYRDVTLQNALRFGYRFLGWYYTDTDGVSHRITETEPLSDTNYFSVSEDGARLKVRMVNTFVIEARYIKIWTVSIQVSNQSGISAGMTNRLPYIDFYGTDDPAQGAPVDSNYANRREITISMDAGSTVYFGLSVGGEGTIHNATSFSAMYDRYAASAVVTGGGSGWAGELEAQGSVVPDNNLANPLSVARYQLTANRQKTLRVTFATFGKLTVENLMQGSALKLSDQLWTALNQNNPSLWGDDTRMVWDGGTLDGDGTVNGRVVINDVPILPGANYNGVFGCKLEGTTGSYAIPGLHNFGMASAEQEVSEYGLIFDGNNAAVTCEQTFKFFHTSESNADGKANLYYPFDQTTQADGTASRPYIIKTARQLAMLDVVYRYNGTSMAGIYVELGADITANLNIALCYEGNGFNGNFNGRNYTVRGFGSNKGGLFGKLYGATVENLKFNNGSVSVTVSGSGNVGYFANEVINSTIRNVVVTKGTSTLNVTSSGGYAGGLIGEARGSNSARTTVSGCSTSGVTVNGKLGVGGLIGSLGHLSGNTRSDMEVTVTSCQANSPFIMVDAGNAGGFIGLMCGGTVTSCTASTPSFQGGTSATGVGGFVGIMYVGQISGSTAQLGNALQINAKRGGNSYGGEAADVVNGGAGGFVGRVDASGTIQNSNVTGSGQVTLNARYAGGFAGVQTEGTISNVGIGSVSFYTQYNAGDGMGGSYGVLVGVLGSRAILQNSTISRTANTNWNASGAVYAIGLSPSFSHTELDTIGNRDKDNVPKVGLNTESHECYNLGGLVGYSQGGKITGNVMSGKIIIHFSCADKYTNMVRVGLLAGSHAGTSNISQMNGNTIRNAAGLLFYQNYVLGGGSMQYQYLSAGSGNSAIPSNLTLGGNVTLKFARCGWTNSINNNEYKGGNAGDAFKTASCYSEIFYRTGVNLVTMLFSTKSFPKEVYTSKTFRWFSYYYGYANNQRQLVGSCNETRK